MDRSFADSFDIAGEWFLPDAPDRRIAGTLSYTPNGAELHLNEAIRPLQGAIFAGDTQVYPLLHGITRDSEAMTLVNAHRTTVAVKFGSGGLRQPEQLHSTLLIVGAHLPADFTYPTITCRVPGLEVWLSQRIIEDFWEKDEATGRLISHSYRVLARPEEITRVNTIGADLGWIISSSSKADPFSSVVVTTAGWISIRPDVPQHLEWFFEQLAKITTLLTFLAGGSMLADAVKASTGIPHGDVWVLVPQPDAAHWVPRNLWNFFIARQAMGASLVDIVTRWFDEYPKVHMPSQLALSVIISEKLWYHVEFLSLAQALEGFHRALYAGEYMTAVDYGEIEKTLRDAIPSNVSLDHKQALGSRIHYGYQFSLAKRLGELAARLSPPIRAMIFGPGGTVPRQWIDTRNYYTHWDEKLKPNVLDGEGMIYAHLRMRHFLRALYLDLAGVPQSAILQALHNSSAESQYLIQINAMESRRRDPTNKSGLVATISEQETTRPSELPLAKDRPTDPPGE